MRDVQGAGQNCDIRAMNSELGAIPAKFGATNAEISIINGAIISKSRAMNEIGKWTQKA